jgi:hypothetical protein
MRPWLVLVLLLTAPLPGCLEGPRVGGDVGGEAGSLNLPAWSVGDWWLYTFVTPEFGEDSARLVVAERNEDEGVWMLGISSEREALRHAVLNHNPFLGRITMDAIGVYENGQAQQVFLFPMKAGDAWSFTLLGQDWSASVSRASSASAQVVALSSEGHTLEYEIDESAGFIRSLSWVDDSGVERLRMALMDAGSNHEGEVHFLRATDLYAEVYENSDIELRDSFLDSGHPSGAGFDLLVWYLDVSIAGGGSGSLVLKDHTSGTALSRAWGGGSSERGAVGSIPSVSGEYQLTAYVQGGSSSVELRVAGAIVQQWNLP